MFSDDRHIVILGDFNARQGASNDYNEILNKLPPRTFLDTDQNWQGDNLHKYLKDIFQFVLNGRVSPQNVNFTCVS